MGQFCNWGRTFRGSWLAWGPSRTSLMDDLRCLCKSFLRISIRFRCSIQLFGSRGNCSVSWLLISSEFVVGRWIERKPWSRIHSHRTSAVQDDRYYSQRKCIFRLLPSRPQWKSKQVKQFCSFKRNYGVFAAIGVRWELSQMKKSENSTHPSAYSNSLDSRRGCPSTLVRSGQNSHDLGRLLRGIFFRVDFHEPSWNGPCEFPPKLQETISIHALGVAPCNCLEDRPSLQWCTYFLPSLTRVSCCCYKWNQPSPGANNDLSAPMEECCMAAIMPNSSRRDRWLHCSMSNSRLMH